MKHAVATQDAPKAIGPYSQAIQSGDLLFISGQIPLDPSTMKLVDGDIETSTRRVMDNLAAILGAVGLGFDDVVKTTIYLIDLGDFSRVNATYGSYFGQSPPARATVQVAALPLGAAVEIDAIARFRNPG